LDNDFFRLFNLHINRRDIFIVDHPVERPVLAPVDYNGLGAYGAVWAGNILNVLSFSVFGKKDNGFSPALVVATLPVGSDQRCVSPKLKKFPAATHIPRLGNHILVLEVDVVVVKIGRNLTTIKKNLIEK
jgi:hypothetical protein